MGRQHQGLLTGRDHQPPPAEHRTTRKRQWQPHTASWAHNGNTVCLAVNADETTGTADGFGENAVAGADGGQSILLADVDWLKGRLDALDADLVLATLSERHAVPPDDKDDRSMAFSDITYIGLITANDRPALDGPALTIRRNLAGLGAGAGFLFGVGRCINNAV
jgi:hypothetical protein